MSLLKTFNKKNDQCCCRYGTECEESAILRYEELVGYSVGCRNEETYVWPLHSSCFSNTDAVGSTQATKFCDMRAAGEAYSVENLRYHRFTLAHSRERRAAIRVSSDVVLDLSSETSNADNDNDNDQSQSSSAVCTFQTDIISPNAPSFSPPITSPLSPSEATDALNLPKETSMIEEMLLDLSSASPPILNAKEATLDLGRSSSDKSIETPSFYIVGKVDGVSMQPECTSSDINQHNRNIQRQMRVVVEVKNRMSRIPVEPPLYDQIQLVAYMLMLGCTHGDLVQTISSSGMGVGAGVGAVGVDMDSNSSEDSSAVVDLTPPSPIPIATFIPDSSLSSRSRSSPSKTPTLHVDVAKRSSAVISTADDNFVDRSNRHVGSPAQSVDTNINSSSNHHTPSKRPTKRNNSNCSDRNIVMRDDFSVYRVDLNASPYFHGDNFFNIIMPRLKVQHYSIDFDLILSTA